VVLRCSKKLNCQFFLVKYENNLILFPLTSRLINVQNDEALHLFERIFIHRNEQPNILARRFQDNVDAEFRERERGL